MSDPGPPFCRVGCRELHEARLRAMVKQARQSVRMEMLHEARTVEEVALLLAAAMVDAAEKRAIKQRADDDHRRAERWWQVFAAVMMLVAIAIGVALVPRL